MLTNSLCGDVAYWCIKIESSRFKDVWNSFPKHPPTLFKALKNKLSLFAVKSISYVCWQTNSQASQARRIRGIIDIFHFLRGLINNIVNI